MKYEEFEARAKSAFDDCSEMKRMLWNMQTVVAAVPDMVRKNERLEKEKAELKRERAELKAENAALKAELDDWKGNAEGFESYAYMRLPVDADGVPIRVGDRVWYVGTDIEITNDDPQQVVGLATVFAADGIYVMTRDFTDKAIRPNMLTHKQPEPPDSWEKLEEDAKKTACNYALAPRDEDGFTTCEGCRFQENESCHHEMTLEVFKRAKRLAGIEEQEAQR